MPNQWAPQKKDHSTSFIFFSLSFLFFLFFSFFFYANYDNFIKKKKTLHQKATCLDAYFLSLNFHKKGGQVSNQMTDLDKDLACWANPCATLLPHRGTTRKQAFPESSSLK